MSGAISDRLWMGGVPSLIGRAAKDQPVRPARLISPRIASATTPSARTLADQIATSHKTRPTHAASVIAFGAGHLAAEHVIRPAGVGQDDRDDQHRADQREALALRRRRGVAERDRRAG